MTPDERELAKAAGPPRWFVHREKGGRPRAYDTETFGGLVCWIMVQKRRTQRSIADAAGIDPSYLHRITTGERDIPKNYLVEAIVTALGVDAVTAARLRLLAGHYAVDSTLEAVRWVLDSDHLTTEDKAEFAATIERLAAWRLGSGGKREEAT